MAEAHPPGSRCVITYRRKEYGATVVKVGKLGATVATDKPLPGGERLAHRMWHEVYDLFIDETEP
jgi:hypothetical protein